MNDDPFAEFRKLANASPDVAAEAGSVPPPPRELTPAMQTHLARQPRGAWIVLVWLMFVLTLGGAFTSGLQLGMFLTPAFLLALGLFLHQGIRRRRRSLRRVLVDGAMVPALVSAIHQTEYRRNGVVVGTRVRAMLAVEGRTVVHQSGDGTMDHLRSGVTIRVLALAAEPDVVVPVVSIL